MGKSQSLRGKLERVPGRLCIYITVKKLGYNICRLSQLHQSGIIIRSLRNASKKGFLKFHPRVSSLDRLVSSFRSPIWLHYWHFYHKYVTKPFPEMLIDVLKRRPGLINREASQHFDFKVFRRLVWKHSLNFMMCTPHTCN